MKKNKKETVICSHCKQKIFLLKKQRPELCFNCKHPYSMKPPIEYKLFILQDKYIENKKDRIISNEFFGLLSKYIYKLLLKKIKGKLSLNSFIIEEKVHYTVTKLFIYYQKPFFKIEGSFGGYIQKMLLDTLYNKKAKREEHDSLNQKIKNDKNEFIDSLFFTKHSTLSKLTYDAESEVLESNTRIVENLDILIKKIFNRIVIDDSLRHANDFILSLNADFDYYTNSKYMDKIYLECDTIVISYLEMSKGIIYDALKLSLMD